MVLEKKLKDLNLLDRFLFAEATEDPEVLECILEIILGKDVVLKHLPQTEAEHRKSLWSKQIRLDVWAMDADDVIYDTEVQKKNTRNLPKRTRFYHGVIDSKLLESGSVDYNQLKDVYVIMITPFDPFGEGRYKYTFQMMCREVPGLPLEDGATRIFLNTRGTDPDGVSQELIQLLRYFERTTQEVADSSNSEKIQMMQKRIASIRSSEEFGVKLMNAWEEKILERQEAREEGLAEGLEKGRAQGIAEGRQKLEAILKNLFHKGFSPEDAAAITEMDLQQVKDFFKKLSQS